MRTRIKIELMSICKKAVFSLMALLLASTMAFAEGKTTESTTSSGFNWDPVMDAIIQVESEGNPNAVSGNSVGAMQITPILVKECNEILKKQKSKRSNYSHDLKDNLIHHKSKPVMLINNKPKFVNSIMEDKIGRAHV